MMLDGLGKRQPPRLFRQVTEDSLEGRGMGRQPGRPWNVTAWKAVPLDARETRANLLVAGTNAA